MDVQSGVVYKTLSRESRQRHGMGRETKVLAQCCGDTTVRRCRRRARVMPSFSPALLPRVSS
eukprot:scaffold2782_cov328-Prasinococcus_capsulatus_cf.AAC.3